MILPYLCEFCARLVEGNAEQLLLDVMLERFKAAGLLKARGRQRTDSTHVLASVRVLNRIECVGETRGHALNTLAVVTSSLLAPLLGLHPEWAERYGKRFDDYHLPGSHPKRTALAELIGADGITLLTAAYQDSALQWLHQLPAIETLRQVWLQQYHAAPPGQPVRWRTNELRNGLATRCILVKPEMRILRT